MTATDGTRVAIRAESICCHGDTPGAVEIAAAVRRALEAAGVRVAAVRRVIVRSARRRCSSRPLGDRAQALAPRCASGRSPA